ncbi:MAG: Rieske (2Fe-2S) protein [Hyphomicrobiaceae bacterium]|nr:Rieske (2Fe-2S) protein [Hyphomicrobiaceae bacterium]
MSAPREVSIGRAEDFPLDTIRIVKAGTREIGVVRRADGTVNAVRNWCPHKGAEVCRTKLSGTMLPGPPGTLTWGHEGEIVRCPWHGFEFDIRTGKRPYSNSEMRLRVYPARVADGEVLVDLGPQRSAGGTLP